MNSTTFIIMILALPACIFLALLGAQCLGWARETPLTHRVVLQAGTVNVLMMVAYAVARVVLGAEGFEATNLGPILLMVSVVSYFRMGLRGWTFVRRSSKEH